MHKTSEDEDYETDSEILDITINACKLDCNKILDDIDNNQDPDNDFFAENTFNNFYHQHDGYFLLKAKKEWESFWN